MFFVSEKIASLLVITNYASGFVKTMHRSWVALNNDALHNLRPSRWPAVIYNYNIVKINFQAHSLTLWLLKVQGAGYIHWSGGYWIHAGAHRGLPLCILRHHVLLYIQRNQVRWQGIYLSFAIPLSYIFYLLSISLSLTLSSCILVKDSTRHSERQLQSVRLIYNISPYCHII